MKTILKAIILELRYWHLRRMAIRQVSLQYVDLVEMRSEAASIRDELLGRL
jgi:hypothetical protein